MRRAALLVLAALAATASLQEVQEVGEVVPAGEVLVQVAEGKEEDGIDVDVNKKGDAPSKKLGYDSIPGFVFRHMGQEQNVPTVMHCEELCDKHDTCRSYSFNEKEKLCVWSIETIRYRLGWEFFTKVHELDAFGKWRHYGKWRSFPDIMYQEPGYTKLKEVSVQNCQEKCNKDEKCKSFAYQLEKRRCYFADSGIHYDPAFTYYERRGMKPRKNVMDEEDKQAAIQHQEKLAKKAKRRRLVKSMNEREDKNARTQNEMTMKGNARETNVKSGEKQHAQKRLAREKTLEARDKRLAKMKARYNEGFFKAKGVAAEKKTKELDIKALRKKEVADKDSRKEAMDKQKNRKVRKERKEKKVRAGAEDRLLKAKEKLTKMKNEDVELEINKEERILDVAKNLGMEKADQQYEEQENEKEHKFHTTMGKKKHIFELRQKTNVAKGQKKQDQLILEKLKRMTEDKEYDSDKFGMTMASLKNGTKAGQAAPKTAPKLLGEGNDSHEALMKASAIELGHGTR